MPSALAWSLLSRFSPFHRPVACPSLGQLWNTGQPGVAEHRETLSLHCHLPLRRPCKPRLPWSASPAHGASPPSEHSCLCSSLLDRVSAHPSPSGWVQCLLHGGARPGEAETPGLPLVGPCPGNGVLGEGPSLLPQRTPGEVKDIPSCAWLLNQRHGPCNGAGPTSPWLTSGLDLPSPQQPSPGSALAHRQEPDPRDWSRGGWAPLAAHSSTVPSPGRLRVGAPAPHQQTEKSHS